MEHKKGPLPSPGLLAQIAANAMVPLMAKYSGELTGHIWKDPLGAAILGGRVSEVFLSVEASGKDDSNTLQIEADVLINGTSCLTTLPAIAHVSGEASQQKTTAVVGDTAFLIRDDHLHAVGEDGLLANALVVVAIGGVGADNRALAAGDRPDHLVDVLGGDGPVGYEPGRE